MNLVHYREKLLTVSITAEQTVALEPEFVERVNSSQYDLYEIAEPRQVVTAGQGSPLRLLQPLPRLIDVVARRGPAQVQVGQRSDEQLLDCQA